MALIKRYEEILEDACANMIAQQDKVTDFNEGSVIFAILDTFARIVERCYTAIRQSFNELLRLLPYSLFGLTKKTGTYATGMVIFTMKETEIEDVSIPKGTKVSGGGLVYETTAKGTIKAGEITSNNVPVIAVEMGSDYNVAAGVVCVIESSLSNIKSVINERPVTGGCNEETDNEFDERFKCHINGLSGTNSYAIKAAVLDCVGVRSASIQSHKPPLNNVYNLTVCVDDGSGTADSEVLEKVKNILDGDGSAENTGYIAPGINFRVVPPNIIPVNINLKTTVSNVDVDTGISNITAKITEYINSLPIGKPFIIAELVKNLMNTSFVQDITVVEPQENIEVAANQIVRAGKIEVEATKGVDK